MSWIVYLLIFILVIGTVYLIYLIFPHWDYPGCYVPPPNPLPKPCQENTYKSKSEIKFRLGEKTKEVWTGDLIREMEFISNYKNGTMIFYDNDSKCFRLAFWEPYNGTFILNGWKNAQTISELIKY